MSSWFARSGLVGDFEAQDITPAHDAPEVGRRAISDREMMSRSDPLVEPTGGEVGFTGRVPGWLVEGEVESEPAALALGLGAVDPMPGVAVAPATTPTREGPESAPPIEIAGRPARS